MSEVTQESKVLRSQKGLVVSDKMDKTVTVMVVRKVKHPLYHKIITRSTKLKAHDESNECREGDTVRIAECRPISKQKAWKVIEVVERAR